MSTSDQERFPNQSRDELRELRSENARLRELVIHLTSMVVRHVSEENRTR